MREIKIKVWDDTLCRMLKPLTIEQIGKCNFSGTNWYQLTYLQYTGLNDKNKKEIYEHDIVKWRFKRCWKTEYHISEVVWDDFYSAFKLSLQGDNAQMRKDIEYEIIGNIFETPELII